MGPPGEAQAAAVAQVAYEVYGLGAYEQLARRTRSVDGPVEQQV
ncbi:hypothetical protein [Streptacidiphilus rugosus]|nr:hypothetical protein [Streptacidiphilus rugosus]